MTSRADHTGDVSAVWKARPESPAYDEMRASIVDVAERLIVDDGAAALRLDRVAADVGCHRSSVYRYFESKEELITEVAIGATLRVGNEVIADLGEEEDPGTILVEGICRSLVAIGADPVHQALLERTDSAAANRVADIVVAEALQPLLGPLLEVSGERGGLRDDLTSDDAMRWLMVVSAGLQAKPQLLEDPDALRVMLHKMLVPSIVRES